MASFHVRTRSRLARGDDVDSLGLSKTFVLVFLYFYLSFWTSINTEPDKFDLLAPPHNFRLSSSTFLYTSVNMKNTFQHPSKVSQLNYIRKNHTFFGIILLLAGDLEQNPGPTRKIKYPCGLCKKACTWRQQAVACDECEIWYHTKCMGMKTQTYEALNNVSWYCCSCGKPNFSSEILLNNPDSSSHSHFNPFDTLSNPSESFYSPNPIFDHMSPPKTPSPILASTPRSNQTQSITKHPHSNTKINELSFLIINFQSLWNKREELSNLAQDSRSDIIIGTETWLSQDTKNSELLLNDYDIFRRDRPNRGGGVLIAVKKNLCCEHISSSKNSESIFCKLKLKGSKPLIIGSVYRPPCYSFEESENIIEEIYSIVNKNKRAVFWFGGDFNLPDIDWENQDITGSDYPKSINNLFLEMAQDLGFSQIVDIPTRGTSILDLLFTNIPSFVKKCYLLAGLGDHEVVRIISSIQPFRKKPAKRIIQLWNKVDEVNLQKDTHQFKLKFLELFTIQDNVVEMWNYMKTEITSIINNHVPTKMTSSRFHQPWINSTTKRLIRKKNRWFKKAKQSNSGKVWKIYHKIKGEAQRACRLAHQNYLNDIFSEDTSNKKLWSYIKSLNQEHVGIGDLKDSNNIPTSDPIKKANIIHDYFDTVFSNPEPKINHDLDPSKRLPDMHKIQINRSGLLKLLLNINIHKANGPDNISGRFLKLCAYEIVDVLQIIFQASLDQGIVPSDWKEANIMPLFKKGDRMKAENYRPISLTSLSCKLLEHVVHSNIMSHMDKFEVLDDAQHGFRKSRSCITQLISTVDDFANCLKSKQQIDAILLDFSKAFDKVDHQGLLSKLEHLGIRHSLLNWTQSFLLGRNQKVTVEGKASAPKPVLSGVPQGTVLGPLLFLVYINDISEGLSKGTKLKLFADDSLLYRTIKTPQDSKILQRDLDHLQKWEIKWKMVFHPDKCLTLKITNKIKPIHTKYFIHGIGIEEKKSAKYLGVIIDSSLRWKDHYSSINKKANNILYLLRRNLNKCPRDIKARCYTTLLRPILEYSSPIWDPHYLNDIDFLEKIQKRAARFVTNNYCMESGNSEMNRKSLGWETLEERRQKTKITIFHQARLKLVDISLDHLKLNKRQTRLGDYGPTYFREFSPVNGHFHSFFPSSIMLWNQLPARARGCEDINIFKKEIRDIHLTSLKPLQNM